MAIGRVEMKSNGSDATMRIRSILGAGFRVLEFEQSTHTSAEAAAVLGCDLAQIAKSMMYQAADGQPVLVVASGANRIDEKKVAALLGQKIKRADPEFVLASTGVAVGGVPPLGHIRAPLTFLDQDLGRHETIWAAAGSPNALFALAPADLVRLTGAPFVDIAK
jgi:prolyl-tRNA editing enzyme YbaK/EbsC (Cys-tRNA(Pro) deacylase)